MKKIIPEEVISDCSECRYREFSFTYCCSYGQNCEDNYILIGDGPEVIGFPDWCPLETSLEKDTSPLYGITECEVIIGGKSFCKFGADSDVSIELESVEDE